MSDEQYTPKTETVRYYATYGNGLTEAEFDRWIAEFIRCRDQFSWVSASESDVVSRQQYPTREQIAEVYSGLMNEFAFRSPQDAYVRHVLGLFKARLEAIIDADEPTRLRTAHLRVDIAALLLNRQYNGVLGADADAFYEGRTTDEQDDALSTADAVLALFPRGISS